MKILNNCFKFSQNVFIRNIKMPYSYCSCYHIDVGINLRLNMINIPLSYHASCAYASCVRPAPPRTTGSPPPIAPSIPLVSPPLSSKEEKKGGGDLHKFSPFRLLV